MTECDALRKIGPPPGGWPMKCSYCGKVHVEYLCPKRTKDEFREFLERRKKIESGEFKIQDVVVK